MAAHDVRELLRQRLGLARQKGLSQAFIAKTLGISLSTLQSYLYGIHTPSLQIALAMEALLSIPVAAWATREDQAALQDLLAEAMRQATLPLVRSPTRRERRNRQITIDHAL